MRGGLTVSRVGFAVLGPLRVTVDGQPVPTGPAKQRALLALLVLRPGQAVPLPAVTEELWHDRPPRSAASNLRGYLAGIRGVLPADERRRVVVRPQAYLLRAGADEVDAARFVALATRGQRALVAGEYRAAADTLSEALALWRGTVAEDVPAGTVTAPHRVSLTEQRLVVREDLLAARLALDGPSGLLTELREFVATEPVRERPWALLMTALHQAGDRGAALLAYDQARAAIVEALGIEPGPHLRRLRQRILDGGWLDGPAGGTAGGVVEVGGPRWRPVWQLPLDVGGFTGRTRELERLDTLGAPAAGSGTVVVISGMGGVGKTALAAHWAHRRADRAPDGQLYLDLRGYGTGRPLTPVAALGVLLRSLGLPPDAIPAGLAERAALWRDTLHGRRVLVLLDNARDDDQVRPLLPGTGLTLVTSRSQLRGLVAREGPRRVMLRRLTAEAAETLLATAVGPARAADRSALSALAERCAGLPLALRIVAERATRVPERGLGELTAELRDQRHRLDSFDLSRGAGTGADTGVRAVLSWSYQALDGPTARLFRLLGLHPGEEFDVDQAAALAGLPLEAVAPLLDHLVVAHLVLERRPGRYAFHDLVGLYAAERAGREDGPADRTAALARLLDWYVRTADQADQWLNTKRSRTVLSALTGDPAAPPARTFGGYDAALDWFRAEFQALLAASESAADHGLDVQCWQLTWTMWTFLRLGQPATTWIELYDRALHAARRAGDRTGIAASTTVLGIVHSALGGYDEAIGRFQQALRLYTELDDLPAQARTLDNLGNACLRAGRLEEGLEYQHRGLRILQSTGPPSEALALAHNNIAMTYVWLDRHDEAVSFAARAVEMSRDGQHEQTLALALDSLGDAHRSGGGDPAPAVACYREAIAINHRIGDLRSEAVNRTNLGTALRDAGDPGGAADAWRDALDAWERLRDPNADQVRRLLADLHPAR
jgi:DNA-binding SARP family transcriptional activator/tetratricopeptide (TPR) repeat protein